jgi:hypothetical protein
MKVISSDGQEFEIEYDIAKQSKLLKVYFDGNYLIFYINHFISVQ